MPKLLQNKCIKKIKINMTNNNKSAVAQQRMKYHQHPHHSCSNSNKSNSSRLYQTAQHHRQLQRQQKLQLQPHQQIRQFPTRSLLLSLQPLQQLRHIITTRIMNNSKVKFFIFLTLYILNVANGEIILRVDPLALLSATLRTYQKAACDTDQVIIACPRGTSISIEFAQYNKFIAKDGISIDELCPANRSGDSGGESSAPPLTQLRSKAKHLLRGSTFGSPMQKVPANRYVNGAYGLMPPPPPALPPIFAAAAAAGGTTEIATSSAKSAITDTGTAASAGSTTADALNVDGGSDDMPENCMWPNALQYSLLQTVVEACQKKKHCKFNGTPQYHGLGASGVGDASGTSSYHSSTASTSAISVDPCPKRRKIVEVAYKCRPYEFRSKVACHNDVAQLECNPYSRIAVYSASFGRTEYESIQCPQPQGVREETCLASYATETVMQICHGRRRCNLAADANTFGSPCQPNSRMYLKVVYTCVPKQVLKDRYESETEADEPEDFEGDINELYDDELSYKESEAIPKLYSNTTTTAARTNGSNAATIATNSAGGSGINNSLIFDSDSGAGGVNPVMTHSADLSLEDDQERFYLYLLIAGSVGVILCIIIVAVHVIVQKRHGSGTDTHSTSSVKGAGCSAGVGGAASAETTIPNGFNDTISEIDADIDLTTPIPVPSVSKNENYITYGPTTSLYGSLGPSNISHTSSTLLLQGGGSGLGTITAGGSITSGSTGTGTSGLIVNPLMCGGGGLGGPPRQSPDLIGISSNAYVAAASNNNGGSNNNAGQTSMSGILTPAIVIGSGGGGGAAIVSSSCGSIGTMVPLTSLAQYTTAPTFRAAGYIINPDGILQRPTNTPTPPTSIGSGSITYNTNPNQFHQYQQQQHQQMPSSTGGGGQYLSSTLRRVKPTTSPPILQQQSSYDGTAPRTLSTGVPINSEFYYG